MRWWCAQSDANRSPLFPPCFPLFYPVPWLKTADFSSCRPMTSRQSPELSSLLAVLWVRSLKSEQGSI